jgi:S1-C subfamily serine protease
MQITKKVLFVIAIILISGFSGIFANRYVFPRLATMKFFAKYAFIKKSTENVTIINKTEQVYIKEESSINKIVSQVTSSVVSINSYPAPEKMGTRMLAGTASHPTTKSGTGLIVTSDGLVVTYVSAIITDNAKYKVMLDNGNIYDATFSGIDSYSNLAFLKIEASNLPVAAFVNSDEAMPGEKIIAVGNNSFAGVPFLAAGVLSSFNPYYNLSEKIIASSEKLEGVFGIDLEAQTHYIGGPIVDYSGQIVGVTGVVNRDNKENFFQIPSNKVKLVIEKAIRKELETNCTLGVYYVPITKIYAVINNLPSESGALIYSSSGQQGLAIIANSPAANAGLKIGDIITAVAEENIDAKKSLPDLLYKHKKGEKIELTILRDSEELKIKVQL